MAIIQLNFYSEVLERQQMLSIAMPQNVQNPPVLYLLTGYTGNHNSWLTDVHVERYANSKGVAVVMPDGGNGWYTNLRKTARYFDYTANEIPALVHRLFKVSDKPSDTCIAGFSMGGYGAIKIALTYPERFRAAASMSGVILLKQLDEHFDMIFESAFPRSGTLDDNEFLLRECVRKGGPQPDLYFCCGTEDPYVACNREFARLCTEQRFPHVYVESPGGHGGEFMDEYFPKIMDHLFPYDVQE